MANISRYSCQTQHNTELRHISTSCQLYICIISAQNACKISSMQGRWFTRLLCLQAKAKGQTVTDDEEAEQQQIGTNRPSEWAGFIYNPYSGDLLPQVRNIPVFSQFHLLNNEALVYYPSTPWVVTVRSACKSCSPIPDFIPDQCSVEITAV